MKNDEHLAIFFISVAASLSSTAGNFNRVT